MSRRAGREIQAVRGVDREAGPPAGPRWARLLCLGWALCLGNPVLVAQAPERPGALPDEPPPGAAVARQVLQGGDPLPDPATWMFDPGARARAWLDKPPISAADIAARPQAYEEVLASHGLALDLQAPMLAARGAVIHDRASLGYPIEYLVVTEQGRTYEAAILVRAMPSVMDACLRAMGLEPGSPTRFEARDPPPSEEQLAEGVSPWSMTRSGGPLLSIRVQWTDSDGLPHDVSLESLLVELPGDGGEPVPLEELGWVFCGGSYARYRQGREMIRWHRGDVEGDVVAIYLDGRSSCLLERNSLDGVDGSLYTLSEQAPPGNTPITLVIRPTGRSVEATEVSLARVPDAARGDPGGGG